MGLFFSIFMDMAIPFFSFLAVVAMGFKAFMFVLPKL